HSHVGWTTRVRLDVGVFGAKELLGTVDGQLLDVVDQRHALVIASARIAFRVLDVQVRRQALQHRRRGVVLTGDEVQGAAVAIADAVDAREDVEINPLEHTSGYTPDAK